MASPSAKARSLAPGAGAIPAGAAARSAAPSMNFAMPVLEKGKWVALDGDGNPIKGAKTAPWSDDASLFVVTTDAGTGIFADDGSLVMRAVSEIGPDNKYTTYYETPDGSRVPPETAQMMQKGSLDGNEVAPPDDFADAGDVPEDADFADAGDVPGEAAAQVNKQQAPRLEALRQRITQIGGDIANGTGAADNLRTVQEALAEVRRTDAAIRDTLKQDPVVRSRLAAMVEFAGGDPLADDLLAPVDAPFNPKPSKADDARGVRRLEDQEAALKDLPDADQEARRQWQEDNRDALVGKNAPESASTQAASPPAGKVRLENRTEITKTPSTRARIPKPPLEGRLSAASSATNREMLIRDLQTGEWRAFDPVADATRASEARVAPELFSDAELAMYHRDLRKQQKKLDSIGNRMQRLTSVRDMFDQQMANAAGYLPHELRTRGIVDASPAERAGLFEDMPQAESAARGAFNPNTGQWDYLSYGTNDLPLSADAAVGVEDELARLVSQRDAADAAAVRLINRMRQIQGNPAPYVGSLLEANPSLDRGAALDPQISSGVSQLGGALGEATSVRELADSAIELQGAINESQMLGRRIAQLRQQLGSIDDGIPGSPLPGGPVEKPLLGEQLQQASAFRVADRRGLRSQKPLYQRQGQVRAALTEGRFGREVSPDVVVGPQGLYKNMQEVMERATRNNPAAQTPEGLNVRMMADDAAKMLPRAYGLPVSPSWNPLDDPLPAFDSGRRYPGRQDFADAADLPAEGTPDVPEMPAQPTAADSTPDFADAADVPESNPQPTPTQATPDKVDATPAAASLAEELGIDINTVTPSNGKRVSKRDVQNAAKQQPQQPDFADAGDVPEDASVPTNTGTARMPTAEEVAGLSREDQARVQELSSQHGALYEDAYQYEIGGNIEDAEHLRDQADALAEEAQRIVKGSNQQPTPDFADAGDVPADTPQPAQPASPNPQAAPQPATASPAARARQRAQAAAKQQPQAAPQPAAGSPAARARQRAQAAASQTQPSAGKAATTPTPSQRLANKTWFQRNYGKLAIGAGAGAIGAYMYSQSGDDSSGDMIDNFLRNNPASQPVAPVRRGPEDAAQLQQTLDRIRRSSSGGRRVPYQTGQNPIGIEMF